jgi:hypothetical protein
MLCAAVGMHIQGGNVGSVHHSKEVAKIGGELHSEDIFVLFDFVFREARIPASAGLKLIAINSGIDGLLTPPLLCSSLEVRQKIPSQHSLFGVRAGLIPS